MTDQPLTEKVLQASHVALPDDGLRMHPITLFLLGTEHRKRDHAHLMGNHEESMLFGHRLVLDGSMRVGDVSVASANYTPPVRLTTGKGDEVSRRRWFRRGNA